MFEFIVFFAIPLILLTVFLSGVAWLTAWSIARDDAKRGYGYMNIWDNRLLAHAHDKGYNSVKNRKPKKDWGQIYTDRRRNR